MQKENCFTDRLKENKRVVIKNKCHSKLDLESHRFLKRQQGEILNQVQDDVFFNYNAFTLIELLVVVLIIGILAAVAVPQYQKAVEKSKAAQALALVRTVYEAQKTYHMANGSYANTLEELAIDIPWNGHRAWSTSGTENRSNGDWSLQLYHSADDKIAVIVGRLQGKYAGGAFGYYLSAATLPTDQLLCFERTFNGVIFSGNAGDYCQKLFRGSLEGNAGGAARVYVMP